MLIAAGAAAVLLLSGFDSAVTPEEISEGARAYIAESSGMEFTMEGSADARMKLTQEGSEENSLDVSLQASFLSTCVLNEEPLRLSLEAEASGDAMGQSMTGQLEMYLVENDDGTGNLFGRVETPGRGGNWNALSLDASELDRVKTIVKGIKSGDISALQDLEGLDAPVPTDGIDPSALKELGDKYKDIFSPMVRILPEAADVSGTECYEMVLDLTGDSLTPIISDVLEASGQDVDDATLSIASAVLSGLDISVTSDYETETFAPVFFSIDLGKSDFSSIGAILPQMMGAGSGINCEIDVRNLGLECHFDFNSETSVVVPEDALAALSAGGAEEPDGGTGTEAVESGNEPASSETEAVQNPDGSWHIAYTNYLGDTYEADIEVPEGLFLSYGSPDYLNFCSDDYSKSVSYSLYDQSSPEEALARSLDVSFFEESSDYSEVSATEPAVLTLEDGTQVYCGTVSYVYGDYRLGSTNAYLDAGGTLVSISVENRDSRYNFVPAAEEEILKYSSCVKRAG